MAKDDIFVQSYTRGYKNLQMLKFASTPPNAEFRNNKFQTFLLSLMRINDFANPR